MVNRDGKNMQSSSQLWKKGGSLQEAHQGMNPYFDQAIEETRKKKFDFVRQANQQHTPGPGYYEQQTGFEGINKKMQQVKQLQDQGIESYGI